MVKNGITIGKLPVSVLATMGNDERLRGTHNISTEHPGTAVWDTNDKTCLFIRGTQHMDGVFPGPTGVVQNPILGHSNEAPNAQIDLSSLQLRSCVACLALQRYDT